MRFTKTLVAFAVATTFASSAIAGGYEAPAAAPEVVYIPPAPAAGFSLPAWVIPAALLAALVAVAATSSESDEGTGG